MGADFRASAVLIAVTAAARYSLSALSGRPQRHDFKVSRSPAARGQEPLRKGKLTQHKDIYGTVVTADGPLWKVATDGDSMPRRIWVGYGRRGLRCGPANVVERRRTR